MLCKVPADWAKLENYRNYRKYRNISEFVWLPPYRLSCSSLVASGSSLTYLGTPFFQGHFFSSYYPETTVIWLVNI